MKKHRLFALSLPILLSANAYAGNFALSPADSQLAVEGNANIGKPFVSVAKSYNVDIQIDPESLKVEKAACSFSFADMDSDEPKRDKKMCKWMECEHYPEGRFELTEIRRQGDQWIGIGSFTMHGSTQVIDVPFTVTREGDKVLIDGETEFDYHNWGLETIRLFVFTVKPIVRPFFHLEGTIASPES